MANLKEKIKLVKSAVKKSTPLYVQFAVSKRCDLKCRMCQAVESRKDERELTITEIEKLADILCELDIGVLVLTGGEPLLRKDLPEVIEAFTKRKIPVRLQTNATLATDRRVEALVNAGLKEVTISLDTLDPVKQDNINNSEGSWLRIIRGLSVFSKHLPLKGNISGINIVVSKYNLKEIPNLIKFTTAIGFYASLIPVHLSGNGSDAKPARGADSEFIVRTDSPDFAFTSDDFSLLDSVYSDVLRMKKNGYLVYNSNRFLRESPDFLKFRKIYWKCDSPTLYFSISPEGRFLPCVDIKTDKSIFSSNFIQQYKSAEFIKEMRDIVTKCPGCMYACWPEVTYLCRDPFVFTERMLQGFKISRFQRKPMTQEEMLRAAQELRTSEF
ncbi:MAG: radical SAM protein [Deltaproteobacteria bacterium]|nr:radical SAM protein [Deltaproteobacteria bacterium]